MTRSLRAGAVVAALAATTVLGLASPAFAHNSVVFTNPAEGAVLTELPESFEIRTSEPLLDLGDEGNGFAFQVQDAAGLYYGDGCTRISGSSMFTTAAIGEAGEYTVTWQLVSADGHTVSGSYAFTWAPEGASASVGSLTAPRCGVNAEPVEASPDAAEPATPAVSSDVWWILGAVGAIVLAAVTTLLLTRRRPERPPV
ncbi:copper resistance CopC family protein [uncultured Schumannella sp.]|uniref:copper resistance CopC family protein n=1 Tax=uncultured Schumannella sp. TaxID=1195956 RepID=UPI0025E93A28|nr:copper resistance CopC family protein [uncultured Schumannella sp.]